MSAGRTENPGEKTLRAENVGWTVPETTGKTPLLDGISFSLEGGEFCILLGRNGSGKTTLCLLLAGLLKPTAGRILLSSRDSIGNCRVSAYLDDPDIQLVGKTVEEELSFGPKNLGIFRKETIEELLDLFNLKEVGDTDPHELSAGEKVKVGLASLLAMEPSFLILDDTTSFLDPVETERIGKILSSLAATKKTGILLSTSNPADIFLGTRVLFLDSGSIVFDRSALAFYEMLGDPEPGGICLDDLFPFPAGIAGAASEYQRLLRRSHAVPRTR